jgi:hypothetical protein
MRVGTNLHQCGRMLVVWRRVAVSALNRTPHVTCVTQPKHACAHTGTHPPAAMQIMSVGWNAASTSCSTTARRMIVWICVCVVC